MEALLWHRITSQSPFDPVDYAKRSWIRLPSRSLRRVVFQNPSGQQRFVPTCAGLRSFSIQIVEVVEIIAPEIIYCRVIPVFGGNKRALFVEEAEYPRIEQRL